MSQKWRNKIRDVPWFEQLAADVEQREKKEQEEWDRNLESLKTTMEFDELKYDVLFSKLRENEAGDYFELTNTLKEKPEYLKYLQSYQHNWVNFLIVPVYRENGMIVKTYKIDDAWKLSNKWVELPRHSGACSWSAISVGFDKLDGSWYADYLTMDKYTGKVYEVDPSKYKADASGIDSMLEGFWNLGDSKAFKGCSESIQDSVRQVFTHESSLEKASAEFGDKRKELIDCFMKQPIDFSWAIKSLFALITSFFKWNPERVIGVGDGFNYEPNEWDFKYLEKAIEQVLNPEKRSELTYLLTQIKDKQMKEHLKEEWIENPTSFDLLLQNIEEGQIMLTNALDKNGKSDKLKTGTQWVSWGRWCHALLISEVKRDSNGHIVDAQIIQATVKDWIHEMSLKEYINKEYSKWDMMLASLPEKTNKDNIIAEARSRIWQKYDKISIVADAIAGIDLDWGVNTDNVKAGWMQNMSGKSAYCSELVFDVMKKEWITLPDPHMSPSDLLTTEAVTPKYCSYCENFSSNIR